MKNKYTKKLATILAVMLVALMSVQGTVAYIATSTNTLINTFKPFDLLANDLIIKKTVEHPFGDDYSVPNNVEFDFEVDLGTGYADKTIKTTAGDKLADANGKFMLKVKANGFVGLQDLNDGSKVKVTEIQKSGNGFKVKDGVVTKEDTALAASEKTLEFINVYSPEAVKPINVDVVGTKVLEGREWKSWERYQVKLEQLAYNGQWVELGTKTSTQAIKEFDLNDLFHNITFSKVGEYKFRLTEVKGNYAGVTYDEDIREFTIKITDYDMDGTLEVYSVSGDGDGNLVVSKDEKTNTYKVETDFKNVFNPYTITGVSDLTIPINVDKDVVNKGTGKLGLKGFKFSLSDIAVEEPMVAETDENGDATFKLKFEPKDIGKTYTFKLSEVDTKIDNVKYDNKSYEIAVTIDINEDNQLCYTMTVDGKEVKEFTAHFENVYTGDKDITPETGDDSGLLLWLEILAISVVLLVILIIVYNRKCKTGA